MDSFNKSHKLENVCYDIRGPVMQAATKMEEEGQTIIKLNIGNPAPFGVFAPDEIIQDVMTNLKNSQGYCESKGLFSARKAIMQYYQERKIMDIGVNDIYIGNGVSELIVMSMQGLLNNGDEVLLPAPDYPLWTAGVNLAGGKAVHYLCDEKADWTPDIQDIESKITMNTKAIVVINPNNPTGAVYPRDILLQIVDVARRHGLIIFSDEIYDKILYDGVEHHCIASLANDVFIVTMGGLSKSHRIAGFRAGWMALSGNKKAARGYIEGLNMLSNMRICSNVPAQHAIQTALGGYQSINEYTKPGGRLYEQREVIWSLLNEIPGVSCVRPKGAFYCFPKLDQERFHIRDDVKFAYDLLRQTKVLIVQGTGFNWPEPDHFRIVFLPNVTDLKEAVGRIGHFLETYRQ